MFLCFFVSGLLRWCVDVGSYMTENGRKDVVGTWEGLCVKMMDLQHSLEHLPTIGRRHQWPDLRE